MNNLPLIDLNSQLKGSVEGNTASDIAKATLLEQIYWSDPIIRVLRCSYSAGVLFFAMMKKDLAEEWLIRLLMALKSSNVRLFAILPRIKKSQCWFLNVLRKLYLDIEDISTYSKFWKRYEAIRMVCLLIWLHVLVCLLIEFSCKNHTNIPIFLFIC